MDFSPVINWTSTFPFLGLLLFFKFKKKLLYENSGEPDQTLRFAASDLVLHCLLMSNKKDARFIWVKYRIMSMKFLTLNCVSKVTPAIQNLCPQANIASNTSVFSVI